MKKTVTAILIICMVLSMTAAFADRTIENVPGAYERVEDHPDCEHVWIIDSVNHYLCAYCNSYGGCVPVVAVEETEEYNCYYMESTLCPQCGNFHEGYVFTDVSVGDPGYQYYWWDYDCIDGVNYLYLIRYFDDHKEKSSGIEQDEHGHSINGPWKLTWTVMPLV